MGRLSEYINGYRGSRSTYLTGVRKTGGLKAVDVTGAEQVEALMNHLLSTDPTMDRLVRRLIAKYTREARNRVSKDIAGYISSDPRKAARAVKHSVYRSIFGANISILAKRKSGSERDIPPPRKLDKNPHQRGGNRRKRSDKTKRMDKYYGADRGFVLRFISSGTIDRLTRYGNRGSIPMSGMFGRIAPWHMEDVVNKISDEIGNYINSQVNG